MRVIIQRRQNLKLLLLVVQLKLPDNLVGEKSTSFSERELLGMQNHKGILTLKGSILRKYTFKFYPSRIACFFLKVVQILFKEEVQTF